MENYFTDAILYEDILEHSNKPTEEKHDGDNEADSEPKSPKVEDFEYEINPLIRSLSKLSVTDVADEVGEWVINEDVDFACVLIIASDSMLSCTNTKVDSLSELAILTTFHLSVRSSLTS